MPLACKQGINTPFLRMKHFIINRLTSLLKSAEIFKVKDEVAKTSNDIIAGNGRERFMIEFKKYDFV